MSSELIPIRPLGREPKNHTELREQVGAAVNHTMMDTYDGPPLPFGWLDRFRKELFIELHRRKVFSLL